MHRAWWPLRQRHPQKRSRLYKPRWMRNSSPFSVRTAVVLFTGHSDPRRTAPPKARLVAFASMIKSRKKAEEMDLSEWSASDGRALEEVEMAKRELLFFEIQ